jgi:hypothetical protein
MDTIYIYGDSHPLLLFNNCALPHRNLFQYGITMFRIGRDNSIYNFTKEHNNVDRVFCLCYGEVDVRCHIGIHIEKGGRLNDICYELVLAYFNTIMNNITEYKQIIIIAIPPPVAKEDHVHRHPGIPFIGTNGERVYYTNIMNDLLKTFCEQLSYTYFDPYQPYKRADGCLDYTRSDNCLHIGDNVHFLNEFYKLVHE